jgi:serine/threonine protein kinase
MMNYKAGRFAQYHLARRIGRGGLADVYEAWDSNLDRRVAIKVLHADLTTEEIENFREEARIMANLDHPHILRVFTFNTVRVLKFNQHRKVPYLVPYLVMDFAAQGSLRQRHPLGERLDMNTIMQYLEQIVDALEYIHDRGLVHLDVKPANMLLGANDEVLLSDFGIARFIQNTHPRRVQAVEDNWIGTAIYMGPERFGGQVSPATDQYALGIILFEWLTGGSPFYGTNRQIIWQHLNIQPPSLRSICPDVLPAIERVVLKALDKNPYARFKNVRELLTALDEARHISLPRLLISFIKGEPLT